MATKTAPQKKGVTIPELARDYSLSASYLYRLAHENKLPGCRRLGYRFVCLREEFDEWLRAGGRD
jgi:excisionase family DNA binding protein